MKYSLPVFMMLTILAGLVVFTPQTATAQKYTFDMPVGDTWQCPAALNPGTMTVAPLYWNNGQSVPSFNKRNGESIIKWDTSTQITTDKVVTDYKIKGCTVTVYNISSATWTLGGLNSDGVQKRLELFGVGFTSLAPAAWTENYPFVGGNIGGPVPPTPRNPWPIDLPGGHAEDLLNATPYALGIPIAYTPSGQSIPFKIQYVVDVSNSVNLLYLQNGLRRGRVFWILSSTIDEPPLGGPTASAPAIVMKEGVASHPGSAAGMLEIELFQTGATVDKWKLY